MLLHTERLRIRPFEEVDVEDVFEIYSNSTVCRYLLEEPWTSIDKVEKFASKLKNRSLHSGSPLSLAVLLDDKVIGDISVWYTEMRETVEIGFVFHPSFSKKGYAKESVRAVIDSLFMDYKVHRIQANLDDRNLASAKLCENLGMRREAHFLQDYWNKGEWTSSFVYGMLYSDINRN